MPTTTSPDAQSFDEEPLTRSRRAQGRVLVIDDEGVARNEAVLALTEEGFDVAAAVCGEEALAAAAELLPDAVVLDVCRAESIAIDLCRRLKAQATGLLPVLQLSAAPGSQRDRAAGIALGADGYLAFPFDPNELRAAVGALLRIKYQDSERAADAATNSSLRRALDDLAEARRAQFESDARFRRYIEIAHEGVLATDSVGTITYANPRILGLLGYTLEALTGLTMFDVMPPAESFEARNRFAGQQRGNSGVAESRLQSRDGQPISILIASSAITDDAGAFIGTLAVISDITDRKNAETQMAQALEQAELDRLRLEAILEAIPVGVWLSDAAGQLTHTNPAAVRLWDVNELPLRPATEDGDVLSSAIVEIGTSDGIRGHGLFSSAAIRDSKGNLTGAVVVGVDLTEHQAAARERENLLGSLEAERARLAAIFLEAPSFLAVLRGPTYVFERVNPAYVQLVGGRNSIGKAVLEALPELRDQGFIEILDRVRSSGEPFIGRQMQVQLARTEGAPVETRYVDQVYQRLSDADGGYSILVHGVDVTDHVVAAQALELIEQRLRDQFAKLPVPTFLWEVAGEEFVLIDCNEAAVRALAPYGGSTLGRSSRELFPGMEDLDADIRRCLVDNLVMRRSVELDFPPPAGRRTFDLTIGPQPPNRLLLHAIDTTDRSELEAQLRQAQKMEAVGRLAGGVAHDFNNILTVIGAHSSFLLESLNSEDPRREDAEEIHNAGVRAAGLTRQLLAFGRKQLLKPRALDLNAIILDTRKLLTRLLGEDIEIVTELSDSLGRVVADPSQIDQVLMNLAVNARDAMPDGGRLTISARNTGIGSDAQGADRRIPRGEYVLLEVADTGTGMDETTQARLFEPFFTTKGPGKGTGLGLSTVHGIVNQSGGYIAVDSVVGHGATFRIYLPVVAASEEVIDVRAAESVSVRGVETVLIVEDEAAVREIAKRVLSRQGYVVLEASNGNDAINVSTAFTEKIHLVLSDAVMPGMSGGETVRRLKLQRPDLKVLFMSGYTDDEVVRRGIVSSAVPFIEKPFAPAGLATAVREALDQS